MNYTEMLNRVAYENALIKQASLTKKADETKQPAETAETETEVTETAGDKAKNIVDKTVETGKGLWDNFKGWAKENQQGLVGAGVTAATLPAAYFGLGAIPELRRRRLLHLLATAATAAPVAVAGTHYINKALADNAQ